MNYRLNDFIIFAAGAAVGAVVSWKLAERYWTKVIDEISTNESVSVETSHEEYTDEEMYEEEEEPDSPVLDEMRQAYSNIITKAGYAKEDDGVAGAYIIEPDEFGELDGYGRESLNYYADGVLTDMYDNQIENAEELIGSIKPLDHFGKHEADSVYVRNDITKTDYEILRDSDNFNEE